MLTASGLSVLVESFDPAGDDLAEKSRELVLGLLRHTPEPFSRHQFTPGHITSTACVLHPDRRRFLIIHHKRLDRWLFPGGHVEPDDGTVWASARREAEEETGILLAPSDEPAIAGIDVHGIPGKRSGKLDEPYHLHHDLIVALAAVSDRIRVTSETKGVAWCLPGDAPRYGLPAPILRAVTRALR